MAENPGEVTNELLLETLKAIQGTLARHSEDLFEIRERLAMLEMHCYSAARRADRIEHRLGWINTELRVMI